MPAMEAIKSATVHAADLLGESENLGSIEKGKYADIIAVIGDPLIDIEILQDVSFVMKDGIIYKKQRRPDSYRDATSLHDYLVKETLFVITFPPLIKLI